VVTNSGEAVRLWDPAAQRWTQIGGPAEELYGGGAGLWAVSPGPGHIAEFRTAGNWAYIGERPAELAVGRDHVYRLAADRASVWAWRPDDHAWQLIGGPAGHLYAGEAGLFATDPDNARLFRYDGEERGWAFVVDGIARDDRLVVGTDTVYRLTADRTAVTALDQTNGRWQVIGGAARTIRAGGAGLFAVGDDGGVLAYRGRPDDWRRIGDDAADIAVGPDRVFRLATDGSLAEWSDGTWRDLRATAREITTIGR
jgi:outer membrane protein assembly factor BamB